MKDLLTKVIASALVSAVISAGMLYFAFDQSLRGVETAIQVQSESIGETNDWIRKSADDLDSAETKILNRFDLVDQKLDQLIEGQKSKTDETNQNFSILYGDLARFRNAAVWSLEGVQEVAQTFSATINKDDPNYPILVRFLNDLEVANENLKSISLGSSNFYYNFPAKRPDTITDDRSFERKKE